MKYLDLYPKVFDRNDNLLAILENAYNCVITDQLITDTNGQETVQFSLPFDDPKADLFSNEDHVKVGGSEFVIRLNTTGWNTSSVPYKQIKAEAVWYDLKYFDPISNLKFSNTGPEPVMEAILDGTDFTVGTVEITTPQDFSITSATNPLKAIRSIPKTYGGELQFDSVNRKVNLLKSVGTDSGLLYAYGKNLKSDERVIDTRYLATRLYPYGANGLSISSVNDGKEYIENYQWYDANNLDHQVKVKIKKNANIGNPSYLKEWGQQILDILSMPRMTYKMAVLLDQGDVPNLGDTVTVYDPLLDMKVSTRVAKRSYNVLEPWKSNVQLKDALYTLADSMSTVGTGSSVASVSGAISQTFKDVVMFNELFNSRADSGFAYWTENGWSVDDSHGVSGSAAFKVDGSTSQTKTLSQTVYPANRSEYTISAQVELDSISKGSNGKIGFQVEIEYEDGSSETKFFAVG